MTINKIRGEKLQSNIKRESANISALSSDKNEKYEYLTGKEMLPSVQSRMIDQAKFTYSLGKAFEKQKQLRIKGKKATWGLNFKTNWSTNKEAIPEDQLNEEAKKEITYLNLEI